MALQKFNQALDAERKAQTALVAAEDRRSELSESAVYFILERNSAQIVSMFVEYHNTNHHNMLSCECFPTSRSSPETKIRKTPLLHP